MSVRNMRNHSQLSVFHDVQIFLNSVKIKYTIYRIQKLSWYECRFKDFLH